MLRSLRSNGVKTASLLVPRPCQRRAVASAARTIVTRTRRSRLVKGLALGGGAWLTIEAIQAQEEVPAFNPEGCRHDITSYWGRVANMKDLTDITTLLTSDEDLAAAQQLLKAFADENSSLRKLLREGTPAQQADANQKLWEAKKLVDAIIHPATGEKMFAPGRMSAFVPVNLPILAGMMIHGPTSIYAAAFWQFANQSINVFCNYVNRSGAEVDWNSMMQSYGLAVGISVGMAMSMTKLMEVYPRLLVMGPMVPYFSVISASTANMLFSRWKEWSEGITVFDADGNPLGTSKAAGVQAVFKTLWTRSWLLPVPLFVFPPLFMKAVRTQVTNPRTLIGAELGFCLAMLHFMLPLALAILPPSMELPVSELEPEFHNLVGKDGKRVEFAYANKGL